MSELIQKIESLRDKIHALRSDKNRDCNGVAALYEHLEVLAKLLTDRNVVEEILDALKTVQGIETLLSIGDRQVSISMLSGSEKVMVFFSDTDESSNHVLESTLPLAIEAAMKVVEKKGAK